MEEPQQQFDEAFSDRLPESEERYRALFNAIDVGFCIIEMIFDERERPVDFIFLEVNPAFERHSGMTNVTGKHIRVLTPTLEQHWFDIYGKVALTGESVRFTNRAAALGRWFDVNAFRVGPPEAPKVGVLFQDSTATRQTQETLRKSEELLRLIFESAKEYAIIVTDLDRKVTAWNSGAERLLGYAEDEMLGASGDVLFIPEDRATQAPQREVITALEQRRAVNERWHLRKDGTRFWGSGLMFPLRNEGGETHGFLKIMRDRTAERQAEDSLRESEGRLRTAVESAQLGTWEMDPASSRVEVNERCRELFGIAANTEPVYETFLNAVHPDDRERVLTRAQEAVRGEKDGLFREEFRVVGVSDGVERWLRAAGQVQFKDEGKPERFVGTVLEITEMVKAREVLSRRGEELERTVAERTEQLRETVQQLETFSYSVVHDMRAPLRSMRSFANVLSEEYGAKLDDTARDYLGRMQNSAARMDALITDVLTYSRVSSGQVTSTRVNLNTLVREIVEHYPQFQESHQLIEIVSPLPIVCGNRTLLTQCISNLLGNALKFVRDGEAPRVVIRSEKRGKNVRLWIEDSGIGIRPEYQDRIFGLFQRLHHVDQYPGTGVGLAVVKRAVERMRGSVGVESEYGKGSRFWIELLTPDDG